MRVLLLGCNGQVGWELQRALAPLGEVLACDFDTPAPWRADFGDPPSLVDLVRRAAPEVIVNAAAHTAVDKAESEPARARALNAEAPALLAREAASRGAWLLHFSTDYVYDGSGQQPRDESATPAPLSVYGLTKLEGDQAIVASGCRHLILRTSWVYAARGGNFARTMLRLAAERDELRVIDDQHGSPTGAELLADVAAIALRQAMARPALGGLYHCVAGGHTNWHAYACHVIDWARAHGVPLRLAREGIVAVPTSAYPTPARRPLNSRLDCSRLESTFGLRLPPWQQGVERMLQEIHPR
jgi:dTDP-4-dehydrorhamnose reductase